MQAKWTRTPAHMLSQSEIYVNHQNQDFDLKSFEAPMLITQSANFSWRHNSWPLASADSWKVEEA